MKIGIDSRLLYYRQGGISQYIRRLIGDLPELDPKIEWRILQSRKDKVDRAFGRRLWTPCHHRWERWSLGIELWPLGLDLLHSPDFIPPEFGAKHFIITVHDLNFLYYPQFLTPESLHYYAGQIEWAAGHADHILADSEKTRQDLMKKLAVPGDKVTTVHLAADERFRPLQKPLPALIDYELTPGYILCVGTLEPRKNIPTLLQAYRILLDKGAIDTSLVLVGQRGWLADAIFVMIEKLHLTGKVHHLQDVDKIETLAQIYNGAGVLTTPSFYEGFGLPALEAMACGTPVVVSNRGSLPEIVGDAGLLVDPEDPQALANTLEASLVDSELVYKMISKGFHQAACFSWTKTAHETIKVYRRVLENLK
ncbi:MAG: glycosyltransferase family 4 protein [Anaerolineales bacterium]|nr:glycosyltransferase family 4 protein [Anaerolineales bacterium]